MPMDRAKFFAALRGVLFQPLTQDQVRGMSAILDGWEADKDFTDLRHLAYCLATAYHETDKAMLPIAEYGLGRGHPYGQPAGPYKQVYYGRGLVQLTWYDNYVKVREELLSQFKVNLDMIRTPGVLLSPSGAVPILLYGMNQGWFTGRKLTDFFNHSASDPVNARRIINNLDKAALIASYYTHFNEAVQGAK